MFEELIAFHCAPALAGIKSANIVSCCKKDYKNIKDEVARLNGELNKDGIYFDILCECDKRVLVMVYRRDKLCEYLQRDDVAEFMLKSGYPTAFSLEGYIAHLKDRLHEDAFPHEIGAFLGYPIEDIYGFIHHDKCLLVGDWKVYHNVSGAKMQFHINSACKYALLKRVEEGKTLSQLFGAA